MKKFLIIFLAIIILVGTFILLRDNPSSSIPSSNNGNGGQIGTTTPPGQNTMIRVITPEPNALIASPLRVTGEARGPWYFEASFPVKIVDANGKILGERYAEAQGEWMTTEFVPFRGTIIFSTSTTATGYVIFEKDNPSGLPENAAEFRVPVRFANSLVSKTPIQDAIKALIAKWNLRNVTLEAASLNNGVLTLTFRDPDFQTSGGSARVLEMRREIEATARQFAGVNSVVIKPDDIFQP